KFPNAIFGKYAPVIADEVFINVTKPDWVTNNTFDQNRAFLGIDIPMSKKTYFEVGYLNQYEVKTNQNQVNNILYVAFNVNA
ncbi:MAG: DUF2490 domain-containing protein, partial [Candidatus Paceibacterales bacterium]